MMQEVARRRKPPLACTPARIVVSMVRLAQVRGQGGSIIADSRPPDSAKRHGPLQKTEDVDGM